MVGVWIRAIRHVCDNRGCLLLTAAWRACGGLIR
jgi:hypothetical protein